MSEDRLKLAPEAVDEELLALFKHTRERALTLSVDQIKAEIHEHERELQEIRTIEMALRTELALLGKMA